MKGKIRNLNWRNRIEEITPSDHRIGTDILLIEDANAIRAEKITGTKPFKLDVSMAIIYDHGEAVSKINMKEYHIKAPAVLIVMHGHTIEPISYSDDLQGRTIVMSESFTERLFAGSTDVQVHSLYTSIMSKPILNFEKDQNVFSMYYDLLLNVVKSPQSEFKIQSAQHLTLAMFYGYSHMKHNLIIDNKGTTRQEGIYSAFIDLLGGNYKNARDIGYYANKLCITSKHLSQVVKEVSGKTALEIIEEYVLTECKALLLSTTMTIQEISDELNFPSQSVFGKYFKRLTGLSPKAYRKAQSQ
jgi:AraC-like DNA-binding protein